MRTRAFSSGQVWAATSLAALVQGVLVVLMLLAHNAVGSMPRPEPPPREMSIAVKPMLDLPLLKKGGKPRPNKLPDKWKPPVPVKRVEPKNVPTPLASKTAENLPDKQEKKPKPEDKPADPETPVAEQVDRPVLEVEREEEDEPNVPEEGAADGVEEGTEKDPLKARAVDLYRMKLIGWFKQGFASPSEEVPCAILRELRASVNARLAPDGSVSSYDMISSGNAIFDARVRRVMDARVGQKVPPPPPNYPDILDDVVHPTFQGKNDQCK